MSPFYELLAVFEGGRIFTFRFVNLHDFYVKTARTDQISLLLGPEVASIDKLTKTFLPKSAIDFTTLRMGEILQARYASQSHQETQKSDHIAEPSQDGGQKQC